MRGLWELVRGRRAPARPEVWWLVKLRDRHADAADALPARERSAFTGQSREEIARAVGPP